MKAMPALMQDPARGQMGLHAAGPDAVLVFKTSVGSSEQVEALRPLLDLITAGADRWNFDLEDRDRILRVEAETVVRERVVALLEGHGFACDELE